MQQGVGGGGFSIVIEYSQESFKISTEKSYLRLCPVLPHRRQTPHISSPDRALVLENA